MIGSVFLAGTEISVGEAEGVAEVEIRRAGSLAGEVRLTYYVLGVTAQDGPDFAGGVREAVIPDGVASLRIAIPLADDALPEGTEAFSVTLVTADGASLQAPRTTRVNILDDEAPSPPPPAEPPLTSDVQLGFATVVDDLNAPLRFAFNPADADQIFIAQKGGIVRVVDLATGEDHVFLDIEAKVNAAEDRGLLGIAMHPDFAANPYVYLYYVVDPPETAGLAGHAGPDGNGNRYAVVARYTADAATGYRSVVPGSEVVLLGGGGRSLADISGHGALDFTEPDSIGLPASDRHLDPAAPPQAVINGFKQDYIKVDSRSHAGGAMVFGPDGALYVATGDGTSYNFPDARTLDVQALDSLAGKILRIDPITGLGLADNPFAAEAADLADNRAKVWQYGLRNPFSFSIDDEGHVVIADVGYVSWEEIDMAGPGANFGWPLFEGGPDGLIRTPGYATMPEAQALYAAWEAGHLAITRPLAAFAHEAAQPGFQIGAIIGAGMVFDGGNGQYPSSLAGDVLFTDITNGNVFAMDVGDSGSVRYLGNAQGLVNFLQGPDGAIWYANLYTGEIGRLVVTAPQEIVALGSATATEEAWRLTAAERDQAGGIASATRIDLRQDARITFEAWFGAADAGGQGIGFALHDDPRGVRALAGPGNDLGIATLSRAVAIEFDTHRNDAWDPEGDHGLIYIPGAWGWTGVQGRLELPELEDGAWHRIEVSWTAATRTLAYSLDGVPRDSFTHDIVADQLGGSPFARFLIAATTGDAVAEQRLRLLAADVTYEDIDGNQAPVIFGGAARSLAVAENAAGVVLAPEASDAERDALSWRIAGGADAARFAIDPSTGALRFLAPPDWERPADAGGDNLYEVTIEARDPAGAVTTQSLALRVTDLDEARRGTAGRDLIDGTAADDTLIGLGGADTLRGQEGDDLLLALPGDGDDLVIGGEGADTYSLAGTAAGATVHLGNARAASEEAGADTLRGIEHATGGGGDDRLSGSAGANLLRGGAGADTVEGLAGDDTLEGEAGADRLLGGNGHDLLRGGEGNDTLAGGEGADTLAGGEGRNRLDGGGGADLFLFDSAAAGPDTIAGYAGAEDGVAVLGSGFGLAPGTDLVAAGRYVATLSGLATAPAGTGQFVFETDTFLLRWDPDGAGAQAAVVIANLTGATGWAGTEIVVL